MIKGQIKTIAFGIIIWGLSICTTKAQQNKGVVKVVGQMKNVMWKGELQGTINLDTIINKTNLYGLGPVENLTGEIIIIDGKSYKSTAVSAKTMKVQETYSIKAPFFSYANISNWVEYALPDSILTIQQLEMYLDKTTKNLTKPFLFKLTGIAEQATIHIVNLPKDTKVSSPDDAHKGQTNYKLKNENVDIIGFFSTEHKTIFTHHDTFLHVHLITTDRQKMGHLDELLLKKGKVKLYLPSE